MDKTSIIGILLAIISVGTGMVMKGVDISVLINPAAILIILAGTAAAVFVAFPTYELIKLPKLIKIIFIEEKGITADELIYTFSQWAQIARKEGLLALEKISETVEDAFLRNGLNMAVEGQSAEYIRNILSDEIDAMEERHSVGSQIFTQAGTYAPTLGVLGAVVGLIAALGNMSDTVVLGNAISAAFVATLMGIFTGYLLWHPFANKLRRKSREEVRRKEMMIEGILSILEGEAPRTIEQKLSSYLPSAERKKWLEGEMREYVQAKKEEISA
ncbi:flagellar motor protein MotA [Pradoshia eiseniae]|uniref:Flagellar motor protein MotA n=1 Tax=Pradoshia eiseniae TaxID=2064768 RepID=A0A2S7MWC2_9BACI|nr:flagellar motor stator protein MotA [Pradoshia eiseniae]PQD94073.1 flagellar motor protein MotA [Pradoshia eiseniae]